MTAQRPSPDLFASLPTLHGVVTELVQLDMPFIDIARRFAHEPGTTLLCSGGEHPCARYNVLGVRPWLELRARAGRADLRHLRGDTQVKAGCFDVLDELLRRYRCVAPIQELPLCAGLLGYFSYDLKDELERLPRTSVDDLGLPQLYLAAPSVLFVEERSTGATQLLLPVLSEGPSAEERIRAFHDTVAAPPRLEAAAYRTGSFESGFSQRRYVQAVEQIREYIAQGDVYQVNMSQRFEAEFSGNAFNLFCDLFEENPAPFFAFVNAEDHQIVSTSPERFIEQRGRAVCTHPIKGTRPRGDDTDVEDAALRQELATSPKDDAELSMIVDLLRNDIGKVCRAGSVRVAEHKRIETYRNVHHLVSIVEGELDPGRSSVDLLRATLPGGSITGCPKIRAMEIIDELEPVRRHVYTGSIGYVSFHDTMDLSIAIRTATVVGDRLVYSVGGGIVYDSDSQAEYEETLHKGRTLAKVFRRSHAPPALSVVWCNGAYGGRDEFSIPIDAMGFQYGIGVFETLRVQRGRPLLLAEHLARFERGLSECFQGAVPDVTWSDVIHAVIQHNGLGNAVAAVKLMAARGSSPRGADAQLLVSARGYTQRRGAGPDDSLVLARYPHGRHTHLASYKTMNYMFYKLAGEWATAQGADEALILNADGTVSETNTANLFCLYGATAYRPKSPHVLPGIMAAAVGELLRERGFEVTDRELSLEDLIGADHVFVTNSLVGARSVGRLDGRDLPKDKALCQRINAQMFGTELRDG